MNIEKTNVRSWGLEEFLIGLVGTALIYVGYAIQPDLNVIQETIVLVLFLGPLLGIAPLPFPNLEKKRWLYPVAAGLLSAVMDSFLVLLLVAAIPLVGAASQQLKFKAYNMIAALIGGLLVYFGEVYALPHYLKYGMQGVTDALFLTPPVLIFLFIIGFFVNRLDVKIQPKNKTSGHVSGVSDQNQKRLTENLIEFAVAITLLLVTHNAVLVLGLLMLYSFISGQGEDFIKVVRHETEMGVMLLLVFAMLIFEPSQALFAGMTSWQAILGTSSINAVISGALLPAGGDLPFEIILISAGSLLTPASSLVGVVLFTSAKDWIGYMKISIPLMILWLVLGLTWVKYLMPESWVAHIVLP